LNLVKNIFQEDEGNLLQVNAYNPNANIKIKDILEVKEGLTFDDVLLIPKRSPIVSRSQTDLKTKLSRNILLNIPLISANMDTVTESNMAISIAKEGGIGIIHRFMTIAEQVDEILRVKRSESVIIEQPYTISPSKSAREASRLMQDLGVSGLLVMDDNSKKLVGIITNRDIMFQYDSDSKVSTLMTKDLVTAKQGTSIEEAKKILHKNRIEKLPVIDKSNNVVGLITSKDIMKMERFPLA
jgi:IMP dehydrogenase